MTERENFKSRLGFILIAAGCAIGLGNVWRFPFITGQYGGAAFVLIYLFFLLIFGFPILVMEFAVGRSSKRGVGRSFAILEKPGHKWHYAGVPMIAGNYIQMMFYTTVTGWMLYYFYRMVTMGDLMNLSPAEVGAEFTNMLGNGPLLSFWMVVATFAGLSIVALGLQRGVERITKTMMSALLVIMVILMVRVLTLPGAGEGLKFYLLPDFAKLKEAGIGEVVFAALGQSFFTLSLGIGSMSIFGSYIKKEHSLLTEAAHICVLDTGVALIAGLIIIPSCFAFGLKPDAGPGLIFATLPNVFAQMPAGRVCGAAFFLFMSFAALSTLVAVFENIVAYWMDVRNVERKKAVKWNFVAIVILSLPCALGFNVLSGFEPFGPGSCVLDLEDFLVSNTLLPLGSLIFVLFCNSRYGWGQFKFISEANLGVGMKFPKLKILHLYFKWGLPIIISVIFVLGYMQKFAPSVYDKIFG
ncbi:Sodium:neurotransmitter symporter family protein [Fibrobacter succinogenes subsp. succinogenes S85]|uniref:Transporter n=1 Tax=Fibrobacter succinogenes (strain ATCC 19169 / S85) TaxID=59374 RepID=C9RPW6_FIBSS|nr:sodium:neurotransmitter symporter [Fibrobacter succinogenes subsp. succinogenes S85]ADL25649.1 Sodium:neurotransmitter symporter family protein [Fibrobacter succinogenes subsp. succinogenes S85]